MLIKNIIQEKGLKKNYIAEKIGISEKTLNNWINYRHFENIVKFLRLLVFLNITIDDIITEYDRYHNNK